MQQLYLHEFGWVPMWIQHDPMANVSALIAFLNVLMSLTKDVQDEAGRSNKSHWKEHALYSFGAGIHAKSAVVLAVATRYNHSARFGDAMVFAMYAIWIAVGLIFAMICLMEIGRRIGTKMQQHGVKPAHAGAVEGALFALLGLLIAFTFSSGVARFQERRELIVAEANDIGTAYLRIDLLPSDAQPAMRNLFRTYLDSRLAVYRYLPNLESAKAELERGGKLQREIWDHAIQSCKSQPTTCMTLILPSLNSMFDITTTRTMMSQFHPPMIVYILLIVFCLAAALLAGYGMAEGGRSWIHVVGFSIAMAMTVFVILDVEYPRIGLIRIDQTDQVLIDLRKSMN